MKAFVFRKTGEPKEVLTLEDTPQRTPGPDEVVVRMRLSPVHASDLHVLRGRFGRQPTLPATPGFEGMGIVEAVGSNVKGLSIGIRVVLLDVFGTWRTHVLAPAERVIRVPDGVTDEDAAQALINPVTAVAMTLNVHKLAAGDTLLQTAAGSTIGRLVLQIAKLNGFRTINLVRRPEQIPEILALGGDVVICTADEDWQQQVTAAAGEKGILHAIDCVAGPVGAGVVRCLAPGGRVLVYGALSSHRQTDVSGFQMPVFAPQLIYKSSIIQGWYIFHWMAERPLDESRETIETVLNHLASGALRLLSAKRYPISMIGDALASAEASGREGKPLLDFTDENA
jgi:NADPH:quinone reductase-like Zn-dependent oxidoreductase